MEGGLVLFLRKSKFVAGGPMKLVSVLLLVFSFHSFAYSAEILAIPVTPDQTLTPGDFCSEDDKDFKEYRYAERMPYCSRNVNSTFKKKIYREYQVDSNCRHRYTIDHFVPLALGGNNDQKNLWPEHVLVKATRERLEQELYWEVEKGKMSLDTAVEIIIREKTQLELDLSHVEGCG